jgi:predicted metal-dependent peptidase
MSKPEGEGLSPDDIIGHITYVMANTDDYILGPMASTKKVPHKLDDGVAARLAGDNLEFDPQVLADMGSMDASTQIKGLIFHVALMHAERKRNLIGGQGQYAPYADLAAELACWHRLENDRRQVSDKFLKPTDMGLPDGLTMEQYFAAVLEKDQKEGRSPERFKGMESQCQQGQGQAQGQGDSQEGEGDGDGEGQDGEGEDKSGKGKGKGKEKTGPSPVQQLAKDLGCKGADKKYRQDHGQWDQMSQINQEIMRSKLLGELDRLIASKGRGTVPAGLLRLYDELKASVEEPWYVKICRLLGFKLSIPKYRYTTKKPSRRKGWPFPGRKRLRTDRLVVAIDTSGSVGQDELTIFVSKLRDIAKRREVEVEVIFCDCEIQSKKTIRGMKDLKTLEAKGGGGTSSIPVFKELMDNPPGMLVYLTDLYIDFPEKGDECYPNYPVIWGVINNDEGKAPFGETYNLTVPDRDKKRGW